MWRWLRIGGPRGAVTVCETCGSACDQACRARQLRDAQRDRAMSMVVRW